MKTSVIGGGNVCLVTVTYCNKTFTVVQYEENK
jgi:hypothetical protein